MVQREVGRAARRRPRHAGLRRGQREGRVLGDGPDRRRRAGDGVRAPTEGRVGARRDHPPRPPPDVAPERAVRARRARRSASAARCCAGRSPASSTPSSSPPPASTATARPEELDLDDWVRLTRVVAGRCRRDRGLRAPAKLTLTLRDHGRPRRRLPPDRRRDGHARPRRRADDRSRRRRHRRSAARIAAACRPTASNLVARALRLVGRTAGVHVDKQIPHGGGLGGGSADAAAVLRWAGVDDLGDRRSARRRRPVLPRRRAGPRAGHRRDRRAAAVRAARRHARRAAAARQHAGRLPGVGRARRTDRATARTTSSRRRSPSSPRSPRWRDRIGELAGVDAGAGRQRRDLVRARASATTPSPPCGARARRSSSPGRRDGRGEPSGCGYLRRWWRVRRSIFLCFFLRIRLRRFLISEPIRSGHATGRSQRPARYGDPRRSTRDAASGVVQSVGHRILVQ